MLLKNLDTFTRGWIVGKFSNNLFEKDYELGFKYYKKGDCETSHAHLLSEEVTIILLGDVKMNDNIYSKGDIVIQEKGEFTNFEALSDLVITAIYRPDGSYPNDKIFK
jgi:hypothetical protein